MFGKRKFEQELDEELRSYVELQAAEKVRRGMSPEDAVREARRELGGLDQVKENVRDVRPGIFVDTVIQEIRYTFRAMGRDRAFALVAILTLALGIGANTAIFSLINSVLLSALPVRDPQSLVMLTNPASNGITVGSKSGERAELTWSEFRQLRDLSTVFSSLMACQIEPEPVPVRIGGSEAEETLVQMVSSEYFSTLGVPALLGRTLSAGDDPSAPLAVISYDYC